MFIVLGATGHVGSAVAKALLADEKPVTIVTRDAVKAAPWEKLGARVAEADVHDTDRLREVFAGGERLFLLNPPAPVDADTDAEEKRTIASIVRAVEGSGLKKIVAESTYGAHPGERCGDLNTLFELERALLAQPIPVSIIRAAYYMSNWDASAEDAREKGILSTMLPARLEIPMVAPEDLGEVAARLLSEPVEIAGLHYVEGPARYSAADVAEAFSEALGKPVEVSVAPRERWEEVFREMGFSNAAAESYARMTAMVMDGGFAMPERPERGPTSLKSYISGLVKQV